MNTKNRDDNGYPLCDDGSIDWELVTKEKQALADKIGGKIRRKITNFTKPKKKRK